MNHGYGIESPPPHHQATHRKATRYLVVIDSGGMTLARLFQDNLEQVGEFDAGAVEVARMVEGLRPTRGAEGPQWDRALEGHSAAEREAAEIYTLDV